MLGILEFEGSVGGGGARPRQALLEDQGGFREVRQGDALGQTLGSRVSGLGFGVGPQNHWKSTTSPTALPARFLEVLVRPLAAAEEVLQRNPSIHLNTEP